METATAIVRGVFPDPVEAAGTILDESQRLTEVVNGLLMLSRLENHLTAIELNPIQVVEITSDCLGRRDTLAMQKGISLSLNEEDGEAFAMGRGELLESVLNNLLANAIRYAKEHVSVTVRSEGSHVLVLVADDGPGIALEDLPHIFERFFTGPGGNFGLGLAIAQGAAHYMGGTLTAANREEGGAIFTLSLQDAPPSGS